MHNLTYEDYRTFPPYSDIYSQDKSSFPRKQRNVLLNKGKIPNKVFFIVAGEAYATNSTGRYQYFRLPNGAYIGEAHLVLGIPIQYCIFYDVEIGCSALTIPCEKFIKICETYPESFRRLRERSLERVKVLREYKYVNLLYLTFIDMKT